MSLDVLVQRGVFGDPPHPRQDKAVSKGLSAQRAPPLRCQDTVNELKTETEAVMVLLVEPERQTDRWSGERDRQVRDMWTRERDKRQRK